MSQISQVKVMLKRNKLHRFKKVFFNPLTTDVPQHIETSQLICYANQLPGFYMMGTLAVNRLRLSNVTQKNDGV